VAFRLVSVSIQLLSFLSFVCFYFFGRAAAVHMHGAQSVDKLHDSRSNTSMGDVTLFSLAGHVYIIDSNLLYLPRDDLSKRVYMSRCL
jgi:hypothetical protein